MLELSAPPRKGGNLHLFSEFSCINRDELKENMKQTLNTISKILPIKNAAINLYKNVISQEIHTYLTSNPRLSDEERKETLNQFFNELMKKQSTIAISNTDLDGNTNYQYLPIVTNDKNYGFIVYQIIQGNKINPKDELLISRYISKKLEFCFKQK
ncbi:MAG: hypothetical protein OEZ01_12920 [Candidatus Heimdallarchaeota archaeon]|nr:hypothetical protein [Candidatus Heimdallarchaeota archaeon]MDH5646909.1 hypothetical protein [Candidatus Heimdallarchaeota archaeon]